MLAQASRVSNAPAGCRWDSMCSRRRAATHSTVNNTRKNGIAKNTGSRIGGGRTSRTDPIMWTPRELGELSYGTHPPKGARIGWSGAEVGVVDRGRHHRSHRHAV